MTPNLWSKYSVYIYICACVFNDSQSEGSWKLVVSPKVFVGQIFPRGWVKRLGLAAAQEWKKGGVRVEMTEALLFR